MSDWNAVHERGILLGKRRARQDHEELCWMVEALELELHRRLGYGSFAVYGSFAAYASAFALRL